MSKEIILVRADDWEGLYVDGDLVDQDHSISIHTLADECGFQIKDVTKQYDKEMSFSGMGFPDKLKFVKLKK